MRTGGRARTGLREVTAARGRRDGRRRWFTAGDLDLTFWYDAAGEPEAFQLAYTHRGAGRAFTWQRGGGERHERVDDGEHTPGRHKQAPLLLPDGAAPRVHLLQLVRERAGDLEPALLDRVLAALRGEV